MNAAFTATAAIAAPPDRLDAQQLTSLVRAAAHAAADHPGIRFDPDQRVSVLVHADERSEVWLICWCTGQDTGFHDHDGSDAVIAVLEGRIQEERMGADGAPALAGSYSAGSEIRVGPYDIHRMASVDAAPAVTVHAYSPPLRGMGAYARGTDGLLRRAPLAPTTTLSA